MRLLESTESRKRRWSTEKVLAVVRRTHGEGPEKFFARRKRCANCGTVAEAVEFTQSGHRLCSGVCVGEWETFFRVGAPDE